MAVNAEGTFDAAARSVTRFLAGRVPMGVWLVTRHDSESPRAHMVTGDQHGLDLHEFLAWARSAATNLLADGHSRGIADASREPDLDGPVSTGPFLFGAFLGAPLLDDDRNVVGALVGISPEPDRDDLGEKLPLVEELAALLSWVLALEIESQQAKLEAVAAMEHGQRDGLTGVLNRRGWDLALEREAHRLATLDQGASVLIIDLDDLKGMNDRYGHAYGDDQIRSLAECVVRVARTSDVVARLGGDEFGVLAPGSAPGTADEMAERLRAEFRRRKIAATVGGAECPPDGNLGEAWRRADMEMYAAKRVGTNHTTTEQPAQDRDPGAVNLADVVGVVVELATTPCRITRSIWRAVRPAGLAAHQPTRRDR
jgi:diguanylate cyclase